MTGEATNGDGQFITNKLLNVLEAEARAFILERVSTKPFQAGEVLFEQDAPLIHIVFPHNGVIAFEETGADGRGVEKFSVGPEGIIGLNYLLGETTFPCRAVAPIAGHASWLAIADFDTLLERHESVRPVLTSYSMYVIKRLMRGIVCASTHNAIQRVATWLLHAHDRTAGESFHLMQKTLATLLSLRVATVSDACSRLQECGAVSYTRGDISITNRQLLEQHACSCYDHVRSLPPVA